MSIWVKERIIRVNEQTTMSENLVQHWCEAIYDAKAAELILYGRALGLSHGESEDVLHETFVTLMKLAGVPAKPDHYVVRCFRNRALNYRRSLWRRLTREWESLRWFERTPEETPEAAAAMKCLTELPVEQREVIVLKVWHGCTFDEIGGLLEISPNTAAGRYRYGLQKMRTMMEGVLHERNERDPVAWVASAASIHNA